MDVDSYDGDSIKSKVNMPVVAIDVTAFDTYDYGRTEIAANLRWLFTKAYGIDHILEDLRNPFYTDQYEQEYLKLAVISLLLSCELYICVCSLILKTEQAASLHSLQSVIQALSRKGIYIVGSDNMPVTDGDLACVPIKMSAHMAMINALMIANTMEMISIQKLSFELEDAVVPFPFSLSLSSNVINPTPKPQTSVHRPSQVAMHRVNSHSLLAKVNIEDDQSPSSPMGGYSRTGDSSSGVSASERVQLHMQLQEKRRAIEHQREKRELLSARRWQKLGEEAYLHIIKEGGGKSDTLPNPLKADIFKEELNGGKGPSMSFYVGEQRAADVLEKKRAEFLLKKKDEKSRLRKQQLEAESELKREEARQKAEKDLLRKEEEKRRQQEMFQEQGLEKQKTQKHCQKSVFRDSFSNFSSTADPPGPKLFKELSAKSNKQIIHNAISHCCLAGSVNEPQRNQILQDLKKCESIHLMILFRNSACFFRALYTYHPDTEEIKKLTGTGPKSISEKMIDKLYRYSSEQKQFNVIRAKTVSVTVDALTIHNHLWRPRDVITTRAASSTVRTTRKQITYLVNND